MKPVVIRYLNGPEYPSASELMELMGIDIQSVETDTAPSEHTVAIGSISDDPDINVALGAHRRLRLYWERKEPGPNQHDLSPSGWCKTLLHALIARGHSEPAKLESFLRQYRAYHSDPKKPDAWFAQEVSRALDSHEDRVVELPIALQQVSVGDDVRYRALAAVQQHTLVMRESRISPMACLLLMWLVVYSHDGVSAEPSRIRLAKLLNCSEKNITTRLAELRRCRCITYLRRADGEVTNKYGLNVWDESHHRYTNSSPNDVSVHQSFSRFELTA